MTFSLICSKAITCPHFVLLGNKLLFHEGTSHLWCSSDLFNILHFSFTLLKVSSGTGFQHSKEKLRQQIPLPAAGPKPPLSWEGAPPVLCRTSPNWLSLCSWKPPPAWSSLHCLHGWCPVLPVHTHPTRMHFRAPLEGHSGMWQEKSSTEGLIWIARGAGLQSAPVSTSHKVQMQPRWLRVFITALMEKLEGMSIWTVWKSLSHGAVFRVAILPWTSSLKMYTG